MQGSLCRRPASFKHGIGKGCQTWSLWACGAAVSCPPGYQLATRSWQWGRDGMTRGQWQNLRPLGPGEHCSWWQEGKQRLTQLWLPSGYFASHYHRSSSSSAPGLSLCALCSVPVPPCARARAGAGPACSVLPPHVPYQS